MEKNFVCLVANLTSSKTFRVNKGISICRIKVAVNETNKPSQFFWVVGHRAIAETLNEFSVGQQVTIEGKLQSREYTSEEDKKLVAVEVIVNKLYTGNKNSGEC